VQVGTTARLAGWETKDTAFDFQGAQVQGEQIVNTGRPPWQIANTQVTLTISNPELTKATLLDVAGYAQRDVSISRAGGQLTLELPSNTMYLVLTR